MPEASPTKWHLAHTTWFFETFLLTPHLPGYAPLDPAHAFLFNSYYKQLGGHPLRGRRGLLSRPSLDAVHAYRRHVDAGMDRLLEDGARAAALADLVELGLNHEQQHQELILTDIKHALAQSPLAPAYRAGPPEPAAPAPAPLGWHQHEAGQQLIGHAGDGFAFDNEGPRHPVIVGAFRLASRLVTNAEYLEFMQSGGYERPELWLSDGWDLAPALGGAPLYWARRDGRWEVLTFAGRQPVALHEPVCHVSYYEADAYARWAGARLPTESEWEVAAAGVPVDGNLLERGRLHPLPAAPGAGAPAQLFGDAWEWTASPYTAYPGYQPPAGVLGEYNGKFMCNQMVLRGGSCVTPRSHVRATYRNFFPPHARWQITGIRLAGDAV
jgi:ergothioneine biosynthesis protein EgtB